MNYITFYRLITKDGKEIIPFPSSYYACFSDYVSYYDYDKIPNGMYKYEKLKNYESFGNLIFEIKISKNGFRNQIFTNEEIIKYVKLLNDFSFICSLDEKDDHFIINVLESDYYSISHIRAGLDFIRVLWEHNINHVFKIFEKLPEDFKNNFEKIEDKFILFQILSCYCRFKLNYSDGHSLPPSQMFYYYKIIKFDSFIKFVKENKDHKSGSFSLWRDIHSIDHVDDETINNIVEKLSKIKCKDLIKN